MDCKATADGVLMLCYFILVPFTLQTVGLFTPKWASNATCDSMGLVYSCCYGDDNDTCDNTGGAYELDVYAFGLEVASLACMVLIIVLAPSYITCFFKEDVIAKRDKAWFLFVMFLYLAAGACSFIGCVQTNFDWSDLDYSFYLCFVSGIYTILVMDTIRKAWKKREQREARVKEVHVMLAQVCQRRNINNGVDA